MKAVWALFVDNAVADKDGMILVRHRGGGVALVALLVIAALTTGAVVLAAVDALGGAYYRNHLWAYGRTLTASIAIVGLAFASLLVPAVASTGIISERESGTLRLLMTTALTPGSIVIGKLVALLKGAAPSLFVMLPLLAGGALFGSVSLLDVGLCLALVSANVVALASVSLAVSASSDRVRAAVPRGVAASFVLVVVPAGVPSAILVGTWAAAGYRAEMLVGVTFVAVWLVVITLGSLLFAREALAPASLSSARHQALLVVVTLLAAPVLAALSASALPSHDLDVEVYSSLFLLGWGGLLFILVLVDVANGLSGVGQERRKGPWQAASRDAWCACVGLALAVPVAASVIVDEAPLSLVMSAAFGVAVVVALWLALAAFLTAGVAGRVQTPTRRLVAVTALFAVLWFLSPLLMAIPLLGGLLPLIDPFSLIYGVTGGVIAPFDTPWSHLDDGALGSLPFLATALLLVLTTLAALARLERFRTRR